VASFNPGRADRAQLLRRLGLPADRRLLVFAGRPAREKKIEVLVEAVERLGDPYHLLLIGAGPAPGGGGRVISLPYEREAAGLARLLASCDAFVHANDGEPFGLVVLEAMACGLPVVGPSSGGVAETVDEEVGQLAARSDPAAFAEAIEALFARDVQRLGAQARARAVVRHGWRGVFERLCRIYAEVTGDPGFNRQIDATFRR
jgi:alpha-1,6-mannosyltransferase